MDMTQHSATSAALSDRDRSETTLLELRDEDLRAVYGGYGDELVIPLPRITRPGFFNRPKPQPVTPIDDPRI
jgi:hypothetical protein